MRKLRLLCKYIGIGISHSGMATVEFKPNYMGLREIQDSLKTDEEYFVEISKNTKKRSLNQNAMLWALIGEINEKVNGTKSADDSIQIYIQIVKMTGARVEIITMRKDAYDEFKRRTAEVFRAYTVVYEWKNRKGVEFAQVACYYGTSKLNVAEMSAVIDKALEYAARVGLDAEYWKERLYA